MHATGNFCGWSFQRSKHRALKWNKSVNPEAGWVGVRDGEVVFSFQDWFCFTRKRMRDGERIREKERVAKNRERERGERLRGIGSDSFWNLGYFSQESVREPQQGGQRKENLPFCHSQYSMDYPVPNGPHFNCAKKKNKNEKWGMRKNILLGTKMIQEQHVQETFSNKAIIRPEIWAVALCPMHINDHEIRRSGDMATGSHTALKTGQLSLMGMVFYFNKGASSYRLQTYTFTKQNVIYKVFT